MTNMEIQAFFSNPSPIEKNVLDSLQNEKTFNLPAEYIAFLKATDGGMLKNGKATFYSISNRLVSGERFYEMNQGQNPKLLLIGHYTTQTSEEDFGYLKGELASGKTAIFVQLEESDEVVKIAGSLEELLSNLSGMNVIDASKEQGV